MGQITNTKETEVALVGAGPIGLEMAVALKQAGIDYLHFEKGQIANTISHFPLLMRFFSSAERIAIAGVPIARVDDSKCTREEYMAYLRGVAEQFDLPVRTFESVISVQRIDGGGFKLQTKSLVGEGDYLARKLILATGDMDFPRRLGLPGEDLPHVSHSFSEPHQYFRKKVLIVGGKNSAVEAALKCFRCGAQVTLAYRGSQFDAQHIKYWLYPDLLNRIDQGDIQCLYETQPLEIHPDRVILQNLKNGETFPVETDFVLFQIGFVAEMGLFKQLGAELGPETEAPQLNERTMETTIPGLYVAGTASAGSQQSYSVFIETCHVHVQRILAALEGREPPVEGPRVGQAEI
jgi:thioredoxin reductase (NADPH)